MRRILLALGIARGSDYRWLQEEAWAQKRESVKPIQPFEALEQEKQAVIAFARKHPTIRHRELA